MNFTISEFCISRLAIPQAVADKILKYHIVPMQTIRTKRGIKIWASAHSGYRPRLHELRMGRDGLSEHVFRNKGAVDWTCQNFSANNELFLKDIINYTDYTRIAVYDTFIHCDYKGTERKLFSSDSNSNWTFIKLI